MMFRSNKYLLAFAALSFIALAGAQEPAAQVSNPQPDILFEVSALNSTSAISSMSGDDAAKTPTSNFTNTFYGRLQGLSVMQGSGQLGYDIASLTIRGNGTFNDNSVAVFIDGFQTDASIMETLLPSEVERVYVLKDAAALSTFGMKGANGVVWIETHRGNVGEHTISYNVTHGWQSLQPFAKPLGSAGYATLYNEAQSNDAGLWSPAYSDAQIETYKAGTGIDVDWYDKTLSKSSPYTSTDISVDGGDENIRYFAMLGYKRTDGPYDIANTDTQKNSSLSQYSARVNLDFNALQIFEGRVNLGARVYDNNQPNYSEDALWYNMATYPNNIYPVYDGVEDNEHWSGTAIHPDNPVASARGLGYTTRRNRSFQANFSLREKLDAILPGLYIQESGSFSTWTVGTYKMSRNYTRLIGGVAQTDDVNSTYGPSDDNGTNQWTWNQFRVNAGYEHKFGLGEIKSALGYEQYRRFVDNIQDTYAHAAIFGRVNYAYDSKYVAEVGFSYCGSDEYAPGNRFRFFPTVSAGWIMSNEDFMSDASAVDFLKLRASAGLSGNDYYPDGRYLYFPYYASGNSFPTGNSSNPSWNSSLIPAYLADEMISAEISAKYNIGVDATLLKSISLTADAFLDRRTGIIARDNTYSAGFGVEPPYTNVGDVTSGGVELSANYTKSFGDLKLNAGGMASFVKTRINEDGRVPAASKYAQTIGNPVGASFGYKAIGFYDVDDFDAAGNLVAGLPATSLGNVQPGDVKYEDVNGDNVISELDKIKISNGSMPALYYSLYVNVEWKGFDFSMLAQGTGMRSINLLNSPEVAIAFRDYSNVYPIAEGRWAYYPEQGIDTRKDATYPRLSLADNNNNYQASTLWIENGSFLKIRNVELGYNLPDPLLDRVNIKGLRVYLNAVNPFVFGGLKSKLGMDPERISGYPGVKSFNLGLNVKF